MKKEEIEKLAEKEYPYHECEGVFGMNLEQLHERQIQAININSERIAYTKGIEKGLELNEWVAYSWENKKSHPPKRGRYLIHRGSCNKMHFEQWNGNGWASSNNTEGISWCLPQPPKATKTEKG